MIDEIFMLNSPDNCSSNVTNECSPFLATGEQAEEFLAKASEGGEAEPRSDALDKWHFVHLH